MHIFQKNILDKLRQAGSLRYSQMQPNDIESSHFKYHLNVLIKGGLVEQEARGIYRLSSKGKSTVDRLSRGRVNPHLTPKIITYTLLHDTDSYYLYRKDKEPYRDLLNLIGGKVHVGESAQEASIREVLEKTGLNISDPRLCGVADIKISEKGTLLTHAVAFVLSAGIDGTMKASTQLVAIPAKTLSQQPDLAPDFLDIVKAIESQTPPFVIELTLDWTPAGRSSM